MNALNIIRAMRRVTFLLTLAGLTVALGGCERWALDRQMEELCQKDGGIKVYETVTLPASDFSNIGQPLARYQQTARTEEELFGPDYKYVVKRDFILGPYARADRGEGQLTRWHQAIYRRSDGRLLGEAVRYNRSGGDGFTYGFQPSGKNCPDVRTGLELHIFVKGN